MPDLTTLGLFAASALALVAIPGPNHVYAFVKYAGVAYLLYLAALVGGRRAT